MRADRSSWKNNPMPAAKRQLAFSRHLTDAEWQRVAEGHVPDSMDDHWFAFVEDQVLYIHNSWTGDSFYKVDWQQDDEGWHVAAAWANADPQEHQWSEEADTDQLAALVSHLAAA